MLSIMSSGRAQILTEPLVEPTTKNLPFGEKEKEDTSKRELSSVEIRPVPIS